MDEYFWGDYHGESAQHLSRHDFAEDSAGLESASPAAVMVEGIEKLNSIHHSEREAIQHIRCIMDIFNSTGVGAENEETLHYVPPQGSSLSTAEKVVAKTVEGIFCALYLRYQKKSDNFIHGQTLEELESLLWKCVELRITPTQTTIETLWRMQQDAFECHQSNGDAYSSVEKVSRRQVGRSVKLLKHWSLLANKNPSTICPPPPEFILSIFHLAGDIRMAMTYSLWSLYENHVVPRRSDFSRDVFTAVLAILAISPPATWNTRETSVLQLLEAMGKSYAPTVLELEAALETAAVAGSSQQATWLLQSLQDRISHEDDDFSRRHLDLWFKAVCNDNRKGSVLYLEHLLLPKSISNSRLTNSEFSKRLQHRDYYNLYLQKLAKSGAPDAGMRAEAAYLKMERLHQESLDDNLRPNDDTLHAVVMAYMNAEAPSVVKLSEVQRFLSRRRGALTDNLTL
jgi:hypothetical protein